MVEQGGATGVVSLRVSHHTAFPWKKPSAAFQTPPAPLIPFMKVAVLTETFPGQRRVALVPATVVSRVNSGLDGVVESESAGGCAKPVVVKRSLSPGFAGIPNPLFAADNTLMYFADGKKAILDLTAALEKA